MLAALLVIASSVQSATPKLQPRTYTSPSGEWSCHVDPSSLLGAGPSKVVVKRGATQVWACELPFTFWEALVTDTGHCAGYAYSDGWAEMAARGHVVVAIVDPEGKTTREERIERTGSRFIHGPPSPNPLGVLTHPELDRFVVRVADEDVNRQNEEWWIYRVSTGEKLEPLRPKATLEDAEPLRWSMDARPVAGTPLTLVQWYLFEWRSREDRDLGTRFVLVDASFEPVWSLSLPKDYRLADSKEELQSLGELRSTSGILSDGPSRFELRHVVAKERVAYEVRADAAAPKGWSVHEVARAPYDDSRPEPAQLREVALRKIASVPLQTGAPSFEPPLRDIEAFDFDAAGAVRFARREKDGAFTLVNLDERGAVVREVRVGPFAPEVAGESLWSALNGERWLLTLSPFGAGARSRAWFVDGASGVASELVDFAGPSVEAVAAAPDGAFVVLGAYRYESTSECALLAFDASGGKRWEKRGHADHEDPASLFSPSDVALDARGAVLVLDKLRHWVQVFDGEGEFVRHVDLETTWAVESSFLNRLIVEPAGTWLIHDFDDDDKWRRTDVDGAERASFTVRRENGSEEVGSCRAVRVGGDGRVWGTDRRELFVIDDNGVARTRFGAPPDTTRLEKISSAHFDGRGRVVLVDERSHALHVFSAAGERERVLVPDPGDLDNSGRRVQAVEAAPDGSVYVSANSYRDRHLAFSAAGDRVGWIELGGPHVAFLANGERWAASCKTNDNDIVAKLAPAGEERSRVTRRPSGQFFEEIVAVGCRPSGEVAVLDKGSGLELHLFDAAGAPERTIALHGAPRERWKSVVYGERWIVVSSYTNAALLIALPAGRASIVRIADGAKGCLHAFELSPNGQELWCATQDPPALHRFALPN